MKEVLKCLQIFNIDELYIQSKLSFLETLKFNKLSYDIFHDLTKTSRDIGSRLKSFDHDIVTLENFF